MCLSDALLHSSVHTTHTHTTGMQQSNVPSMNVMMKLL